ncbi:MAG: nicotinate-nucleotide adenylyltransferase [Syntrophobacterales bacterium]|nr:nicotinate-nucleotide adenylyltransferase [Syntrophobacterales bacterium]
MDNLRRLGVFGGSFNPIHFGHLRVAEEVCEELKLDQVIFIPTFIPPHKDVSLLVPFEHRYNMLGLAIGGHPKFAVSDIEAQLGGVSYTVRTLNSLIRMYEGVDIFFLIGSDAFLEIDSWWHYKEIFNLASIVIMIRPGASRENISSFISDRLKLDYYWIGNKKCFEHPLWRPIKLVSVTLLDISASKIREFVSLGRSIRFLVPEAVREYIICNRLYV